MINFFDSYHKGNIPGVYPPQWNYIKTGYDGNLKKVQEYYRFYAPAVSADHFLVRLLQSIAVDMDTSISQYYKSVEARAQNLAMVMGITSSISKGEVFDGVFYGPGNTEILISLDIYTDPDYTYKNWETVSAVYPLLHEKSDMAMLLPNGTKTSEESGLSVIAINLPQLAVQYKAFIDAQKDNLSGTYKTTQQFVGGYVLTNMLEMHNEIALFNRIYLAECGVRDAMNTPFKKHSFTLPYYDAHLDVAIAHILQNIRIGAKRFDKILKTIPALTHVDMLDVLVMPDVTPTTQVDWALCACRLKAVDFLIRACDGYAAIGNQATLNQIARIYRSNNVGAMIHQQLPKHIEAMLDDYMEKIISV